MSLRIGYLPNSAFAIIVLGMINATASEIAKDPHTVSDHFSKARETALSLLVGRFIVVGSKPDSGQTYRGSVDGDAHARSCLRGWHPGGIRELAVWRPATASGKRLAGSGEWRLPRPRTKDITSPEPNLRSSVSICG
jgi:hypothetical protein